MSELWSRVEPVATSPWAYALYAIVGAVVLSRVLLRILRPSLLLITSRTQAAWDDRLVGALSGPLSTLLAVQAFRLELPWLAIDPRAILILREAATLATVMAVLWLLFRLVDLASTGLSHRSWAESHPGSRSLISLGSRFAKVALLILGVLVVLAQMGVSVASLIAGLGIGGLAVALAAQKTVENVFGAITIAVDQPMREGDGVTIGPTSGTVERIGLRSTRIRTAERTIITIPNGELANQRIETFAERDRIRLFLMLRLVKDLEAARLATVIVELELLLRAQPKVLDGATVRFVAINNSSYDVELAAYVGTTSADEFQQIRQTFYLALLETLARHEARLAHPTRALRMDFAPAREIPVS